MNSVMYPNNWILLSVNIITTTLFYFNVQLTDHFYCLCLCITYHLFRSMPLCIEITVIASMSAYWGICHYWALNNKDFHFPLQIPHFSAHCQNVLELNLRKKKKIGLPLVIQHHLSPLILSSFHLSLSAFPSLFPKDTALCVCTVSLHVLLWTISNVSPWKGNAANCYDTSDEIVCVCASVTGLGFLSWSSNK